VHNTQHILRHLVGCDWIDVAFLLDSSGRLLSSVGKSTAFSATGEFQDAVLEGDYIPDTCLYVTAVNESIYLGVLFSSDTPIEEVRAAVDPCQAPLSAALDPG
jgi:hypothetical protein